MRGLAIVGAAGHGREVAAVLEACARAGAPVGELLGFLDDDPALAAGQVAGIPVLGPCADVPEGVGALVLGVGYPEVKARVVKRLLAGAHPSRPGAPPVEWPAVVHPAASLGARVKVGRGAFVQAGVALSVDVTVGEFATINLGATVSHDCRLGAYATLSPGAHIGGAVRVEEGVFVGIGASVVQGVRLGPWSVVGAGAVVIDDVPAGAVVAGVPARPLSPPPEPGDGVERADGGVRREST